MVTEAADGCAHGAVVCVWGGGGGRVRGGKDGGRQSGDASGGWGGGGVGGGDGGQQSGDASRRGTEDTVQSMPCLLSQPPVDGV